MQEINIGINPNKPQYTAEVLKLRKEAQELGIDEIKYIKLANNATLADIRQVVQSKELRRHETASQLAIRAYRMKSAHDSKFKSFAEVAKAIGANPKRIVEVKKVVELYGRNDIIDL